MTELSPAARAVLDAVCANTEPNCDTQHVIAAALRALADQVVPYPALDFTEGEVRDEILAIANELENND